jgi:hypothetical protein
VAFCLQRDIFPPLAGMEADGAIRWQPASWTALAVPPLFQNGDDLWESITIGKKAASRFACRRTPHPGGISGRAFEKQAAVLIWLAQSSAHQPTNISLSITPSTTFVTGVRR